MGKKNFKKKVKGAVKWGQKKYEEYQASKAKAREQRTERMAQSTKELKSQVAYEHAQNELARARAERRKISTPSTTGMGGGSDIYGTLFGGSSNNSGGDVNAVLFGGPVTKTVPVKAMPVKKKYKYYTKRIPVKKAPKRRTIKYRTVKRRVLVKTKKTKPMPAQPNQPSIVDMI